MVATDLLAAKQRVGSPASRWMTRFLVTLPVILVILGSDCFARQFGVRPGETTELVLIASLLMYVVAMALPFVPGIEIGLAVMLMFGQGGILLVYLATLVALTASFLLGRLVPVRSIATVFGWLRLRRARRLLEDLEGTAPAQRIDYLASRAPAGRLGALLRHRHLALAVLLNLPGNAMLGGAGGIGMLAGMSGAFRLSRFILLAAVATTPVPLLFLLSGAQ